MKLSNYIAPDLLEKFEFYNYNHALEIISQAFPQEWSEIQESLRSLSITVEELLIAATPEASLTTKFFVYHSGGTAGIRRK